MKNLTEYNDFKGLKRGTENTEKIIEGAQLFDDNNWKVRTRVEIPTSLINAYVKKVLAETGVDPKKTWSEQELAEEITKYISTAFLAVENLPASIVVAADKLPTVQAQEDMPVETDIQSQVQPEVQVEEAPAGQEVQGQGQTQFDAAQDIPQSQPQAQGGQPAQEI